MQLKVDIINNGFLYRYQYNELYCFNLCIFIGNSFGYVFFFLVYFVDYYFFNLFKFFYVERKQIKEELEDQYQLILDKNVQEMEDMKKIFEEKLKEVEQKGVILICLYIVVMKLLDNNFVILIFFILEILNFLIINL